MQTALPGPVTSFNMADYFFQYMCFNNKRTATEMDTVPESSIHLCTPSPFPVSPRDKEHNRVTILVCFTKKIGLAIGQSHSKLSGMYL